MHLFRNAQRIFNDLRNKKPEKVHRKFEIHTVTMPINLSTLGMFSFSVASYGALNRHKCY